MCLPPSSVGTTDRMAWQILTVCPEPRWCLCTGVQGFFWKLFYHGRMLTMHWMHVNPLRSCNTCDGFQLVPNQTGFLMNPFHFWCQFTSISITQLHRMRSQLRFSSKSLAWPWANTRLLLCEWPCSFMLPWVWLVSCWAGLKNWWCGNSLLAGALTAHVLQSYDDWDHW